MVTSTQIRMARAAVVWTVRELADKSGVHRNTIVRIEAGEGSHGPTLAALQRAFEEAGIEFLEAAEGVGGPGVRWKAGVTVPFDKKRGAATDSESGSDVKALDADAGELIAYWSEHPSEWGHLSLTGRGVLSVAMYGDVSAADERFGS